MHEENKSPLTCPNFYWSLKNGIIFFVEFNWGLLSPLPLWFSSAIFESLIPLFQNAKHFIWKWVLHEVSLSCKSKSFIRMVSHLASLWNRGTRELGDGILFVICFIVKLLKDILTLNANSNSWTYLGCALATLPKILFHSGRP